MGMKRFLVSLLRAKFPRSRFSLMSVVGEKSLSLQERLNGNEAFSNVHNDTNSTLGQDFL